MPNYLKELRQLIGKRRVIHPAARIIIENDRGEILFIHRIDNDQWGVFPLAALNGVKPLKRVSVAKYKKK